MKKSKGVSVFLFLFPYMLIFFLIRLIPSIAGIGISFTKWSIIGSPKFIGLANYIALYKDSNFHKALVNTLMFLLVTLPMLIILSLFVAIVMNQKIRGRNAVRTIAILPYVIIPAVVGIMWNWLYEANFGIINFVISKLGGQPIAWLLDKRYALSAVSVVIIWSFLGYNMILYLAGLQGLNAEVYEAAEIDGANKWQQLTRITWPLLLPTTSLIVTLTLIHVMQVYDQVVVMTGGGPSLSTMTLLQYQYISGFERQQLGYGSAVGVVTLIVLIVFVKLQQSIFKSVEE